MQPLRLLLCFAAIAVACSGARLEGTERGPAMTMPSRLGEAEERGTDGGVDAAGDARQLVGAAERDPGAGSLPDPEALREQRHFEYEIVYEQGKVRVASVHAVRFTHAVPAPHKMGRYAIELWIGKELLERVRFDVPLVAAEDPRHKKAHPLHEPPSFASGVVVSMKVLVPASARATRAVLWDRATNERTELPWPPDAPLAPPRTALPATLDGGVVDAGPSDAASGD
ncbi:MAG: hypothetical protein U0263_26285 [Polyangiaceae bacterium]